MDIGISNASLVSWSERESENIINFLSSEETMNIKAKCIALSSAMKIELADGYCTEANCCLKTDDNGTLSPFLRHQYIWGHSEVNELISANCCSICKGLVSVFVCSKLNVDFGFYQGGLSGIKTGAMASKLMSEFSQCDFILSSKDWI